MQDLLYTLLPADAHDKCHLYTYLTNSGGVSVVLEAWNFHDHKFCQETLNEFQAKVTGSKKKFQIEYNKITEWILNKAREILNVKPKNSTESSNSNFITHTSSFLPLLGISFIFVVLSL